MTSDISSEWQKLLTGRKISREEFLSLHIGKLELLDGEICGGEVLDLLTLLIKNVGLVKTIDLFPREYWLKALERSSE